MKYSEENKQVNSEIKRDMAFGQPLMIITTPDDDIKRNIDCKIGSLGVSLRRRRLSIKTYRQISIRHKRYSGAATEQWKMLEGESKARIYIQEFTDAWVICDCRDIFNALKEGKFKVVKNHDNATEASYISLNDIPHLMIPKY